MNKIDVETLDNGLKIYFYKDNRKHSTYVNFVTKFGGIHQNFKLDNKDYTIKNGMAHLLEHYICEANEQGEFINLLGKNHMFTNATTSLHKTCFYFMTSTNLEYGLEVLIKGINSPIFSEEKLKKVKAPIYQELKMHEDDIFYSFNHRTYDALFHNVPFKDVGGFKEEVNNITLDEVINTYKAFYQPTNQMLFIAGKFDKDKILKLIMDIYKDIKIEKHNTVIPYIDEPLEVKKKKSVFKSKAVLDYASISYKIDASSFNPKKLQMLDFYLNGFLKMTYSITSELYKELVHNKIIDTGISHYHTLINKFCILDIGAFTYNADVLIQKIHENISKVENISLEDFELYKKEMITKVAIRPEKLTSVITPLIDNITVIDYPQPDTLEDMLS